jgi:diguanylate cyclase (GGDEF)-like protein/PAS domain S-box-containing protein
VNNPQATIRSMLRVMGPSLVVMVVMLGTAVSSILALSSIRAYVARSAVLDNAERDTAVFILDHAASQSPKHKQMTEASLSIWEGDRTAITELNKPHPDYAVARRGLLQAGSGPADVDIMITLFRAMRWIGVGQDQVELWNQEAQAFAHYLDVWREVQARGAVGPPSQEEMDRWRAVAHTTHEQLLPLERTYAARMNENARALASWLTWFLVISFAALLAAGLWATHRVVATTEGILAALRAERERAAALRVEQERAAVLLSSIGDGVISTDRHGVVQFLNQAAEQLTGWTLAEARGKQLGDVFQLLDSGDTQAIPVRQAIEHVLSQGEPLRFTAQGAQLIRRDGSTRPIGERAAPVKSPNGEILGMVVVMRDVTPERRLSDQLRHQALHDPLTGLPNRAQFEQRLESALKQARKRGTMYAVMFVDLDQFKIVNDTCGHHAGDEVICLAGAAIQQQLREGDLVARLGGDEFGVVLKNLSAEETLLIAERIRKGVEEIRFTHEGRAFPVGASIGVAYNDALESVTDVLCAADRACYAAKEAGRNQVRLYCSGDRTINYHHGDMQWIARLNDALEQNRLELYAQEIRSLSTKDARPSSYELLLRLRDEDGTIVTPGAFIHAAERFGLMPRIDRWVIERAFREQRRRLFAGLPTPLCMINLSRASINNADIADFISERLSHFDLPPQCVGFELTETTAIGKLSTAVAVMSRLRALGCTVALDDFGSGMSSYGYLRELPVDVLKIDGSFVRDMTRDALAYAMVEAMHKVARAAGLRTVAEWVEDDKTIDALTHLKVDFAQGRAIGLELPWAAPTADSAPQDASLWPEASKVAF